MKLQTRDGTVYHARFRHYLPFMEEGKLIGATVIPCGGFWVRYVSHRPMTEVVLSNGLGEVTAESICSPRDVFTKARGRQIALGRALKKLVPDVPRRAELWADYLRQVGGE